MTRVAVLSSEYPPSVYGGLGRHVEALTSALARDGHEIVILAPAGPDYAAPPPGVEIVQVASRAPRGQEELWLQFAEAAAQLKVVSKAEVVHGNDWMTAVAGIQLREMLRVPLVFTVHLPQLGGFNQAAESLALLEAECVIVHSRAVAGEIAERQLPLKSLRVIANGVDAELFQPPRRPRSPDMILLAGRLVPQKGVDTALQAFAVVLRRCPDARLVLAGDGHQRLYLERLARHLGVASRVAFVGWKTGEELVALYQEAAVVIMPSRYEPFGLVALEAMACGCAVVASCTGGLGEVIEDGRSGLLVPPGDHLRLAQQTARMLTDPEAAARIGARARARAGEYAWDRVASGTGAAYAHVAGEGLRDALADRRPLADEILRSTPTGVRLLARRLLVTEDAALRLSPDPWSCDGS